MSWWLLLLLVFGLIGFSSCDKSASSPVREPVKTPPADLTPSTVNDATPDIVGWNGVAWGTSRDEAAKLLAPRLKASPKKAGELLIEGFTIQRIEYAVTLLFNESGLYRVVLRPTSALDIPDFALKMLKEGLQDKYGVPAQHETDTEIGFQMTVTSWIWQRPHGTIALEYSVPTGSKRPIIGLIYARRTVLPEL